MILLLLVGLVVGAAFLLGGMASEVEQETIEQEVELGDDEA
ncbi:hypothetical protein WJT74_01760 [Sphingomicrobium sp. XHP0239]